MYELTLLQKCISAVATVNDGRLDNLTLFQLRDIINIILQNGIYDAMQYYENYYDGWISNPVNYRDIAYIYDIINELIEIESA